MNGGGAAGPPRAGTVEALLERGRLALDADDLAAAHAVFAEAHALDITHPAALSLYGLTLALVEHQRDKGLALCEEAIRRGGSAPDLLINLARVHLAAHQKRQAVRLLDEAAAIAPEHPDVLWLRERMGVRSRPPIPFLSRHNAINVWLGRWLHRRRR